MGAACSKGAKGFSPSVAPVEKFREKEALAEIVVTYKRNVDFGLDLQKQSTGNVLSRSNNLEQPLQVAKSFSDEIDRLEMKVTDYVDVTKSLLQSLKAIKAQDLRSSDKLLKELAFLPSKSDSAGQGTRQKVILAATDMGGASIIANILLLLESHGMFRSSESFQATLWSLRVIVNFGNIHSTATAFAVNAGKAGVIKIIVQILADPLLQGKRVKDENVDEMLKDSVNALHCLSRAPENRQILRGENAVNILSYYLELDDTYLQARSLLVLANILDENEATRLDDDVGFIPLLVRLMQDTLKQETYTYVWLKGRLKYHFSLRDLLIGLEKVSVVDANKGKIVQCEAFPSLKEIMKSASDADKVLAAKIVWSLAFDSASRETLLACGVRKALEELCKSENQEVRVQAKGALWKLEPHGIRAEGSAKATKNDGHVMLSYSWSQQKLVLDINKALWSQGYNVWMDVEQMSGSTLEAMAAAVEQSKVVVVCMSSKYKDSPSCRTEAEYTFQLRKPYIPLIVEEGYKPDGWLGIMLGARLYVDFTIPDLFSDSMSKLYAELGRAGIAGAGSLINTEAVVAGPKKRVGDVNNWQRQEVMDWMGNNGIPEIKMQRMFGELTGSMVAQLQYMQVKTPQYLYESLEKLGFSFAEVVALTAALNKLGT